MALWRRDRASSGSAEQSTRAERAEVKALRNQVAVLGDEVATLRDLLAAVRRQYADDLQRGLDSVRAETGQHLDAASASAETSRAALHVEIQKLSSDTQAELHNALVAEAARRDALLADQAARADAQRAELAALTDREGQQLRADLAAAEARSAQLLDDAETHFGQRLSEATERLEAQQDQGIEALRSAHWTALAHARQDLESRIEGTATTLQERIDDAVRQTDQRLTEVARQSDQRLTEVAEQWRAQLAEHAAALTASESAVRADFERRVAEHEAAVAGQIASVGDNLARQLDDVRGVNARIEDRQGRDQERIEQAVSGLHRIGLLEGEVGAVKDRVVAAELLLAERPTDEMELQLDRMEAFERLASEVSPDQFATRAEIDELRERVESIAVTPTEDGSGR